MSHKTDVWRGLILSHSFSHSQPFLDPGINHNHHPCNSCLRIRWHWMKPALLCRFLSWFRFSSLFHITSCWDILISCCYETTHPLPHLFVRHGCVHVRAHCGVEVGGALMQTRDLVAHYLGMGDPRKYNSSFVMLHTVYIPTCLVPGQMLGAVGRWVGTGQGGVDA